MMSSTNPFIIVIDTEQYAGNFEREMCAYTTGQVGECGVGDELLKIAQEEMKYFDWWEEHIVQVSDEDGCHRPAAIWPTKGWFNNGVGYHIRKELKKQKLLKKKHIMI